MYLESREGQRNGTILMRTEDAKEAIYGDLKGMGAQMLPMRKLIQFMESTT